MEQWRMGVENLSCDFLTDAVIQAAEKLSKNSASHFGLPFKSSSEQGLAKLRSLSESKKSDILAQIETTQKILSRQGEEDGGKFNHDEWSLLLRAMDQYGLHLKDDFHSVVSDGEVIEIYNSEHIQIFRTFTFYNYSAYSYIDLLVREWYELWERPKHLIEELFKTGQAVVQGRTTGIVSMSHIPLHVYKEIYNSEGSENFEVRSVLCQFGHIAPLYTDNNEIGGFIINCRPQVVGRDQEAQNLIML